ncbi:MAG: glycoside hydrolase family 88 protein [Opitutus sp.]|nr:glycoside hydrolase family 88 protein [Opitutus sp.]MCS6247959.1 glycoside hydrolase family 88 protein [Opitutus sp.]MCS6275145.1 glycoside hydrolase family 88 protein [Opitutus sp.]MCS6278589.1 glycoside hydrolase family 88 protein [Opitutus sp.]MCS6300009.1 glycoside hydrolase family 88 protein [Opitutus sp.]
MIHLDPSLTPAALAPALDRFFAVAKTKITSLDRDYDETKGSPVFTVAGRYTTRGWTEWTEGFRYGIALLHFDATGDTESLASGRSRTVSKMASHVSHIGVHDHGFNNLSTYGNLLRLLREGRLPANEWEKNFYELALKTSGAIQAARWTDRPGQPGYIHSFNGAHSLFVDTIRSCRILMVAHRLGHVLMSEGDKPVNLLDRALQHITNTARFNVFYGEGRDRYDESGRTAHEAIFNVKDGAFRCPNSQQGYTGFSTWTRGQAWALLGFAEELEFLAEITDAELAPFGGRAALEAMMLKGAIATAEHYIANTPTCGIPYWDTGAPKIHLLGDYQNRPADPYNAYEPVDSSAAAIDAQGLLRLSRYLQGKGDTVRAARYLQAGLTVAKTLFSEPYLSTDPKHQGLILHSIYHQPNGWDYTPDAGKAPYGESSMWGDYHAMELAVYLNRLNKGQPYYTFFA